MCSDGTTEMSSTFKPDDVGARGTTSTDVSEAIARWWLTPPVLKLCSQGHTVRTMKNCYCMTGVVCSAGADMRQCKVPMYVEDAIVNFLR